MTREAAVVTPGTEAGRALLAVSIRNVVVALRAATGVPQSQEMPGATYEFFATEILATEAEAIATERARLRDAVKGLQFRDPEDAGYVPAYAYGFNDAIDRVIQALLDKPRALIDESVAGEKP